MPTLGDLRYRPVVPVVVLLIALLATLGPAAPAAHADSGIESEFVAAANRERAAGGLPALTLASDLTTVARRHSVRMADQTHLHHNPNLGSEVSSWQKVGENVGRGPSTSAIHRAFMDSPGHRRNILDASWTQIGIGVEVRGDTVWVTQVFRLPAGAPPQPEPEPSPQTTTEPASAAPAPEATAATAAPVAEPATTQDRAPSQPPAAPAPPAPPEPHEVIDTPLPLDRMVVTLARLEATDTRRRLDDILTTDETR